MYAFGSYSLFNPEAKGYRVFKSELNGLIVGAAVNTRRVRKDMVPLLTNFADVVKQKDMFQESKDVLKPSKKPLLVGDFLEVSEDDRAERVIWSGWMKKKGLFSGKRFFILISKPVGIVCYTDNPFETNATALEFIDFTYVKRVENTSKIFGFWQHLMNHFKTKDKNCFEIKTFEKTLCFECETQDEVQEWLYGISDAMDVLKDCKGLQPIEDEEFDI
eukprot:CAMPEP_0174276126 /NCGR_PEP_ID=MMETSP0439-20130205/60213_1 /TAXON_ID=0 /ORGANISM="Stereomyxa ramosa, Strain Chinc5" /LENGTH=217 /DNA_ID=CAMNT_0015368315 /DNA_START=1199 /DNA_END=1852 /DNA_ORIENTATION=+